MKKQDVIGQVILKLTDGKPTTDMTVRFTEIEDYIAPAVNLLNVEHYSLEAKDERYSGANPLLLQVIEGVVPVLDAGKKKYILTLPKRALSVINGNSIAFVGKSIGMPYVRIYPEKGEIDAFYWQTKNDKTSYSVLGNEVILYNGSADPVFVHYLEHISELDDDDEIIIPSGMEMKLVDIIISMMEGGVTND